MNILVLGSEGFIGKNVVSYYLVKGYSIFGADLYDVGSQPYHYVKVSRLSPAYDELLNSYRFDVCINAAGSGSVPYSMTHPVSDFESNSLDTMRLLDGIRRYQPKCKYLHISSAAVYGSPAILPVKESAAQKPLSPYGWHKLTAELICQEFTTVFGIPTVVVRPFSVYGPGLKKQLFWDIFRKEKDSFGGSVELWGVGTESRDFIYISDLVKAFDTIIKNALFHGEVFNVASGSEVLIKDAASIFLSSLGVSNGISFNGNVREGDPQNWLADVSKLKNIGFQAETSMEEGLNKLAVWLKDQS
jgi:UDP-glucose 4-epimerase